MLPAQHGAPDPLPLALPARGSIGADPKKQTTLRQSLWSPLSLLVAVVYSAVIAAILWGTNSLRADCCGYPDEPSHYINGLLIRDYIAHGIPQSPMKFAIDYYLHYPKVTLGHWPPLFHLVEGLWMLLFSGSRLSLMVMMGCWALLLAMALWWASQPFGRWVAFIFGLLLLILPITQDQVTMTMTEIPLSVFSFLAILSWARYLDGGRKQNAIWFGVLASCAILVKGDAWALAPTAMLATLLSGRWLRMREAIFWFSPALVAVTCIPYYWLTRAWASLGWFGGTSPNWAFTREELAVFLPRFVPVLGWAVLVLLIVGVLSCLFVSKYRKDPFLCAQVSFLLMVIAFEVIIPAGMDGDRKLYSFLPECLLLSAFGLTVVAANLIPRRFGPHGAAILAAATVVACLFTNFAVVKRFDRGFRELAIMLRNRLSNQNAGVMVISGGPFDGAIVSEFAGVFPYRSIYMLRATEFFTDTDWAGPSRLLYNTTAELDAALSRSRARVLVVHHLDRQSTPLTALVETLVQQESGKWSLLFERSMITDRGAERVQAWDLHTPPQEPDLTPVLTRLYDKRLSLAHPGSGVK